MLTVMRMYLRGKGVSNVRVSPSTLGEKREGPRLGIINNRPGLVKVGGSERTEPLARPAFVLVLPFRFLCIHVSILYVHRGIDDDNTDQFGSNVYSMRNAQPSVSPVTRLLTCYPSTRVILGE
jgi:hypothetical protein